MKILFVGGYEGNSGPEQVNRRLIRCFDEDFQIIRSGSKLIRAGDILFGTLFSDVVVISGLSGPGRRCARIAGTLKKPLIYLMHGCVEYESERNGFSDAAKAIAIEKEMLETSNLILAVSESFCSWLKERYPVYANKISFLYNGVEAPEKRRPDEKKAGTDAKKKVIAIGGNRVVKNNAPVSMAVEQLDDVKLEIYGKVYSHLPKAENCHTRYCGEVPQEELCSIMSRADLFVLNSEFETFSLAVIEAINHDCSVLVSAKAGICGLLTLKDSDIIDNPYDVAEIRDKIAFLLDHPNAERIAGAIDYQALSYENEVRKLKSIAKTLRPEN